jgi:hypothetical protein
MILTADLTDLKSVAAAYRAELAQYYLTGVTVQKLLGINAATLKTWRRDNRLLSVWHSPSHSYLYPDFQFDHGKLVEQMPELLSYFRMGHYSEIRVNSSSKVEWFMSPHALLDGLRPAEMLATDPQRVLKIGRQDLLADPNTLW